METQHGGFQKILVQVWFYIFQCSGGSVSFWASRIRISHYFHTSSKKCKKTVLWLLYDFEDWSTNELRKKHTFFGILKANEKWNETKRKCYGSTTLIFVVLILGSCRNIINTSTWKYIKSYKTVLQTGPDSGKNKMIPKKGQHSIFFMFHSWFWRADGFLIVLSIFGPKIFYFEKFNISKQGSRFSEPRS